METVLFKKNFNRRTGNRSRRGDSHTGRVDWACADF